MTLVSLIPVNIPISAREVDHFDSGDGKGAQFIINRDKQDQWWGGSTTITSLKVSDKYIMSDGDQDGAISGAGTGEIIDSDKWSAMDLLRIASQLCDSSVVNKSDYGTNLSMISVGGLLKSFHKDTKKEDIKANSELGIFRDLCVGEAVRRLTEDKGCVEGLENEAQTAANNIVSYYKNLGNTALKDGGVTGVFYNEYGIQGTNGAISTLESITDQAQKTKTDTVEGEFVSSLGSSWNDQDIYDSTRRAVIFLTEENNNEYSNLGVIYGAKNYYGKDAKDNDPYIVNYDSGDSNQKTLNSIIWTMVHNKSIFNNQAKNYSILSLILQRGSVYSYSKNMIQKVEEGLALKSNTGADTGIERELADINKQIEDVIKNASLESSQEKVLYTTGLRMQYAFYAMQYGQQLPDNTATQLTFDDSDKNSLRIVDPIVPSTNYISNLKGYTMLNNMCNEIAYTANVVLPTLGGIKTKENLNASSRQQLRYLRSAYDAWIFMRDKSNINPSSSLKPLQDAWNKKVKVKDGETSLAETFERLSQFIDMDALDMSGNLSGDKPFKNFFDSSTKELSLNLKYGISLSASFIPFKTNVYESVTYKQLVGHDDFFNFHILYGYYRKPLYIDTNISSVSDNFMSGRVGTLKLCTLKDMLQCEKEISLYTDDNFFNIDKLEGYKQEANTKSNDSAMEKAIKTAGSADMSKITEEYVKQKAEDVKNSLVDKIKDANSVDLDQVLKNGVNEKYPAKMGQLTDYAASKKEKSSEKMEDIILDGNDIDVYLGNGDKNQIQDPAYNVMTAYAVTSAIGRDKDVFNMCNNIGRVPVFKSSKNIAKTEGANRQWKSSLINYSILKNSKANMNISYSSNLDQNKPVYMDIYGNILTESGYVIIPAASNATLNKDYQPYNAGFLTTYGKEYSIPLTLQDFVQDSTIRQVLAPDANGKVYSLQGTQQSTNVIDLSSAMLTDEDHVNNLINVYAESMKDGFNSEVYIPEVLLEVLRGAPLENIDKAKEGLIVGNIAGNNGIEQAAKLELFQDNFLGKHQAAILSLPNIAFCSGIEFIIPLLFKIVIIGVLLMTFKYIYLLGVKRQFTFREVGRYFLVLTLTLAMIYVIPKFFNFCYYWSNRALLQNEALNIAMVNYEKKEAGLEVGIQDVNEANPKTVLYMKMKDLDIPWYTVLRDISLSPVTESLTKLYTRYAEKDLAYSAKNFKFVAGDLYESVDDILDATSITFNPNYKGLYDVSVDETPASFYTPYYVFLKQLTINSNKFNIENNVYSYSVQTYKDGKIKSLGLIKPYMESSVFSDEEDMTDILNLRQIYGRDKIAEIESILNQDDLASIQGSNWCNTNITDEQFNERYEKINRRAKKFVAEHKELLGRISDETFLKMMALDLAIYHNQYFNVEGANSLDIFNLASEDIARLAITNKSQVIIDSPLSFARFVFEEGGEISIYFATILLVLFFLNSWISPIVTCFVFIAIFSSLFMRKIIFEKEDDSLKGYFYIGLYMGGTCLGYALLLKLSTLFTSLEFTPVVNILFLIIVHIAVILMMLFIGTVVMLNWKDLGSAQFSETTVKIGHILKAIAGQGTAMANKMSHGISEGGDRLKELLDRKSKRKEANKGKGLFDYGRNDEDVMDDTGVNRIPTGPTIETNKRHSSIPEYIYTGGMFVTVKTTYGTTKMSLDDFRRRYGISPEKGARDTRSLNDRLNDKLE